MKRPIFIHYETKNREFDGKLLLISHLLKYFETIYFGHYYSIKREALANNNGIIIFKSLTINEENFYIELKKRGYLIVLLHAEGGIHYKDNKSTILSYFNPSVLKYVDFNFVYGGGIRKDIIKYCGENFAKKTIVSGEPRFDLLKPKFRSFFDDSIRKLKKNYGNFILINTSFGAANPFAGKKHLTSAIRAEPTYNDETKKLLFMKMDFLDEVLSFYSEAIQYVARLFPEKNFIVRPHPSESEQFYIIQFKNFKNIFVTKKNNVVDWILASKGIVHYDCTTGMEAALAQKPVISFLPKKNDDLLAWLPIELSKQIFNQEDLSKEIEKIFMEKFSNKVEDLIKTAWKEAIHNVEHESSEIISNTLKIYSTDQINHSKIKLNSVLKLWMKRRRRDLSFVKTKLLNRKYIELEKFGKLSATEVEVKVKKLLKIYNTEITFCVKKISNDVVLIKR